MALPLSAGLVGALVAAFTLFAMVLPAAAAGEPTVTSISPTSGAAGTSVTITGSGFTGATAVDFGSTPATSFSIGSDTSITAVAPAPTGTSIVDVTVTNSSGTSAVVAGDKFTYTAVTPTITAVSPTTGAEGTSVMITGTGFTGTTAVKFGTVAATSYTVNSDTQLTAVAPDSTGTVDITAATSAGTSATSSADHFTYTVTVTGVTPNNGPVGTNVVISGTGFNSITGAPVVKFGTVTATGATVTDDTHIAATVPAGLAPGQYAVSVGSASLSNAFTVSASASPTISPTSGPAGTAVTITGTGFTGATGATIGGVAITNFNVASDTSITGNVPTGLTVGTAYPVVVATTGGNVTLTQQFTVTAAAAPAITSISPTTGTTGTTVTITGTGFTGATAVMFGSTAATSFTVDSDTQITAVAPAGTDMVDITVTTPAGTSTTSTADQFTYGTAADQTVTVTLQGQWTLIGWVGEDGISVADALRGGTNGPENGTNDITSDVSVIWGYDAATQTWQAYFPNASTTAGNDLTELHTGLGYFVALIDPSTPVQWTMQYGNVTDSSTTS